MVRGKCKIFNSETFKKFVDINLVDCFGWCKVYYNDFERVI